MTDAEIQRAALQAQRAEYARILRKRDNNAGYTANAIALRDQIAGLDAALAVYDNPPDDNGGTQ